MAAFHCLYYFMLVYFICYINGEWIQYRGLWYFFSDQGVQVNYKEAIDECDDRGGHLATIVDRKQEKFLTNITGNIERWIGLSTKRDEDNKCDDNKLTWSDDERCSISYAKDIYNEYDENSDVAGVLSNKGSIFLKSQYKTIAFICQWECQTLHIRIEDKADFSKNGAYTRKTYHNSRKIYLHRDKQNVRLQFLSQWTLGPLLSNSTASFTPYYLSLWKPASGDLKRVNFVCSDCHKYKIVYRFADYKTDNSDILYRNSTFVYESITESSTLEYNATSLSWCYVHNKQLLFCSQSAIFPNVGYAIVMNSSAAFGSMHCITDDIDMLLTRTEGTSTKQPRHKTGKGQVYAYIGMASGGIIILIIGIVIAVALKKRSRKHTTNRTLYNSGIGSVVYSERPTDDIAQGATRKLHEESTDDKVARSVNPYDEHKKTYAEYTYIGICKPLGEPEKENTTPVSANITLIEETNRGNIAYADIAQSLSSTNHQAGKDTYSYVYAKSEHQKKPHQPEGGVGLSVYHRARTDMGDSSDINTKHSEPEPAVESLYAQVNKEKIKVGSVNGKNIDNSEAAELYTGNEKKSVFDKVVFDDDPEGEHVEMWDNTVYGQNM